jgi:hypothetical protein
MFEPGNWSNLLADGFLVQCMNPLYRLEEPLTPYARRECGNPVPTAVHAADRYSLSRYELKVCFPLSRQEMS